MVQPEPEAPITVQPWPESPVNSRGGTSTATSVINSEYRASVSRVIPPPPDPPRYDTWPPHVYSFDYMVELRERGTATPFATGVQWEFLALGPEVSVGILNEDGSLARDLDDGVADGRYAGFDTSDCSGTHCTATMQPLEFAVDTGGRTGTALPWLSEPRPTATGTRRIIRWRAIWIT